MRAVASVMGGLVVGVMDVQYMIYLLLLLSFVFLLLGCLGVDSGKFKSKLFSNSSLHRDDSVATWYDARRIRQKERHTINTATFPALSNPTGDTRLAFRFLMECGS